MNKIVAISALVSCLGSHTQESVDVSVPCCEQNEIKKIETKTSNLAVCDSEKSSQKNGKFDTNIYRVTEKNRFKHIKYVGQKSSNDNLLNQKDNDSEVVTVKKHVNRSLKSKEGEQNIKVSVVAS